MRKWVVNNYVFTLASYVVRAGTDAARANEALAAKLCGAPGARLCTSVDVEAILGEGDPAGGPGLGSSAWGKQEPP